MPRVVSVNVGQPREISWNGVTVHTGAWKDPVPGPRRVRRLGIDGDAQGDTHGHGGPHRAVLVYQTESYEHWRRHFGRDDLQPGAFAENLTVEGLADSEVCIGDRYRIGTAEFEVSQPRVTCFRAGLRIGEPQLSALLVAHHRPGFYMRVISGGDVQAGDRIVRTAVGDERVTVAAVDALLYLRGPDAAMLQRAVRVAALSPGWRGSLHELLDAVEHPASVGAPAWTGFRPMRVLDVIRETEQVSSFVLAPPLDTPVLDPQPGQYLSVRLPAPGGDVVRNYSLSAPGDSTLRISVKREPGGAGSGYLHDVVHKGAVLDIAAPRGTFVLDTGTGPLLLASAGIGVTPLLAMLHRLAAVRAQRTVWWLHAARRPNEHAFAAEASRLLAILPQAHGRTFYSADSGRLRAQDLAELRLPHDATAYVCGPAGFMEEVTRGLIACGLDPQRIHTEAFGGRTPINPGVVARGRPLPHPPAGPAAAGPAITFGRSGITAAFDERRASILEFAESCDIPTRWQCRSGVCGTCQTPVLAGEVAYDPHPLADPPPGTVLVCCARPRTPLVLDM